MPMIGIFLSAITQFVIGFIEIAIVLRIVLKMLGASTAAPFVAWLYETTGPMLAPFNGVFPTPSVSGGFVLEISALVALVVYGLVGFLINTLVTNATKPHEEKPEPPHRYPHDRR